MGDIIRLFVVFYCVKAIKSLTLHLQLPCMHRIFTKNKIKLINSLLEEDSYSKNGLYENDTFSIIILFLRYSDLYILVGGKNIFSTSITCSTVSTAKIKP